MFVISRPSRPRPGSSAWQETLDARRKTRRAPCPEGLQSLEGVACQGPEAGVKGAEGPFCDPGCGTIRVQVRRRRARPLKRPKELTPNSLANFGGPQRPHLPGGSMSGPARLQGQKRSHGYRPGQSGWQLATRGLTILLFSVLVF